jgi:hypothetical protein
MTLRNILQDSLLIPVVLIDIIHEYADVKCELTHCYKTPISCTEIIDDQVGINHYDMLQNKLYFVRLSDKQSMNKCILSDTISFKYNIIRKFDEPYNLYINDVPIKRLYGSKIVKYKLYKNKTPKAELFIGYENHLDMIICKIDLNTNIYEYVTTTSYGTIFISESFVFIYTVDNQLIRFNKQTTETIIIKHNMDRIKYVTDNYIYGVLRDQPINKLFIESMITHEIRYVDTCDYVVFDNDIFVTVIPKSDFQYVNVYQIIDL